MLSCNIYAQTESETVFVTIPNPEEKPAPEYFFSQVSLGFLFRGTSEEERENDYYYDTDSDDGTSVWDFLTPDGLSAHAGYGVHLKRWVAISANTGVEWVVSEKLVTAPVYASLVFNPQISGGSVLYLQAGYGRSFAIGRGNLSGHYYKGRIGLINDDGVSLYLDLSGNDFPLHDRKAIGTISVGVALLSF